MNLPVVITHKGHVVIFGAGEVGKRKVEYVLQFAENIKVIDAKPVEMPEGVKFEQTEVTRGNIPQRIPMDTVLVIAALSDRDLNHAIAEYCTSKGILVNVVDDPEPSTVFFSAYSRSNDITVTVSTGGKVPFLARKIREETDHWIELKQRWLEVLAPIREELVGEEDKNPVLERIYADETVRELVETGDLDAASRRAREVLKDVCG